MGMSLSITGYMTVLALVWTSTKATPFGHMIARKEFQALDRFFFRTLRHTIAAFAAVAIACIAVVALLPYAAPHLAARMVPAWLFAALVLGAGANLIVQCLATLLRAFKREPFLIQSLAAALLTLLLARCTAPRWGNVGAAISYFTVTASVALPSALTIFARARRDYLAIGSVAACSQRVQCRGPVQLARAEEGQI